MHLEDFQPRGRRWAYHGNMMFCKLQFVFMRDAVYCDPYLGLCSVSHTIHLPTLFSTFSVVKFETSMFQLLNGQEFGNQPSLSV